MTSEQIIEFIGTLMERPRPFRIAPEDVHDWQRACDAAGISKYLIKDHRDRTYFDAAKYDDDLVCDHIDRTQLRQNDSVHIGEQMIDITAPHIVQFQISADGTVVWVNVDGICRLRCCMVQKSIVISDDRKRVRPDNRKRAQSVVGRKG